MSIVSTFRALLVSGLTLSGSIVWAQSVSGPVEVNEAVKHDISPPLRDIVSPPFSFQPPHEIFLGRPSAPLSSVGQADPVLQRSSSPFIAVTIGMNFDGVGLGFVGPNGAFSVTSAPPDTNGAVGTTQYVQWVNQSFAVFDKATGTALLGPQLGNSLWQGFGGGCETNNDGDPIIQFDKSASRWVFTQFSVNTTPFLQCVAVSTTADATGTFFRYAFVQPNFNDYPKLSVWPDAYYVTFNMFDSSNNFVGPRACALDRSNMLTGASAIQVCFQLGPSVGSLLPSDLDGSTPPPAGSPNFIVTFGTNSLILFKFHVDFVITANSTFSAGTVIPVAPFSAACGGGTCIPQPGTSQLLDSLADRLMYRLAYRNFRDHEALVVNHSVAAGSSVGLRWYEIRSPNATPTVFQQGTFAPDGAFRWMGSIAMDHVGDIALGYSTSSGTSFPSIRFTGRTPSDTLNTLQSESSIQAGSGSQTGGLARWGDYSAISVDPVDDCTFWYTNEYLKSSGSFNWSTRIANFKFPGCSGTADFSLSATPPSQTVTQGQGTSYTVTVTPFNGFSGTVGFNVSGLPAGAGATFNPTTVTGSGNTTMSLTTAVTTPTGSYPLTITGTSGTLSHTTKVTLVVNAPADFSLSATPPSRTILQGGSTTYTITITPSGGFNGTVGFNVSGLPAGATATFNPTTVTGSGNTTMNVTTTTTTAVGTYPLTITGTSGSLAHSAQVTLVIVNHP